MDASYGSFRNAFEIDQAEPEVARRERRLHVRALDYWNALRTGDACPSVHDLNSDGLTEFSANSVLLDFTRSTTNPGITFIGRALREECGTLYGIRHAADVPAGSLLSRLTEECGAVLTTKRPLNFEDVFANEKGESVRFRGVLLPLSSDGETIDYVYGVINWKSGPMDAAPADRIVEPGAVPAADADIPFGLETWLAEARGKAEQAQDADLTALSKLHAALGLAYAFALLADARPDEFAALLAKEGVAAQPRAPMLPVVKLVFGATRSRTRLSDFAAVLSHARHLELGCDDLAPWLDAYAGGIKAVVKAERARRAPAVKTDPVAKARIKLRLASLRAQLELDSGEDEFVLLVARRMAANRLGVLAAVTHPPLVDRALRLAAR